MASSGGSPHTAEGSGDYSVALTGKTGFKVFEDMQLHWKHCTKCQSLVYGAIAAQCAGNSGGSHEYASEEYQLGGILGIWDQWDAC